MTDRKTSQPLLDDLVRRILGAVQPDQIILFGSSARGEARNDSDLDVLVVVPDGVNRRETAQRIYREMIGLGQPVDIVVATFADVARFRHSPATVIAPALRDGRILYAA